MTVTNYSFQAEKTSLVYYYERLKRAYNRSIRYTRLGRTRIFDEDGFSDHLSTGLLFTERI